MKLKRLIYIFGTLVLVAVMFGPGGVITATATDNTGRTSEFSVCKAAD